MYPFEYEWDFIWMTLVVFIPSVFALGLLFFPRGKENAMRWWSLIGTALTLGVSLGLVLLTTALCFLAMIASWKIDKFVRGYCMLFLILETGMLGTFLSLDFFLFYIFWEVMLLPMYFLIGVWGGPRREYAAIKFFLYTLLGSVFILIALLGFYFADVRDFDPRAKT